MGKVFVGLLFVILDFTINLNEVYKVGLLPDFIGYVLIVSGLTRLGRHNPEFVKAKNLSTVMVPYSMILYVLDLTGFGLERSFFSSLIGWIFPFLSMVGLLLISNMIVVGIKRAELEMNVYLNGRGLSSAWGFLAIAQVASIVVLLLPFLFILAGPLVVINVIAWIYFLVVFYKVKELYIKVAF